MLGSVERIEGARESFGTPDGNHRTLDAHLRDDHGATLGNLGRYDEALDLKEQALAIRRETLGEDHPDTARSLDSVGMTLYNLGHHREAQNHFESALSVFEERLGIRHPRTLRTLKKLAKLYARRGGAMKGWQLVKKRLDELDRDHPSYQELKTLRDDLRGQVPGMR